MAIAEVQCFRWTSATLPQDRPSPGTPHERRTGSAKNENRLYASRRSRSAPVSQHAKVSRFRPGKRIGLFFRGSRRRIKIRRAQEKIVGLGIDLHRLCPVLSLDRLNLAELVRRIFVENVDHALASRDEQHTRC